MRRCVFFLLLCFSLLLRAQSDDSFLDFEVDLIREFPHEMMRVYTMKNPEDSLVLVSISRPIAVNHELTNLLAKRMLLSVQDPKHSGVGIAAPQVGINRRMIVVQRFDKPQFPFEVFLNPKIVWSSNLLQKGPEGDLSFDERATIMRHYAIKIRYQNLEGEWKDEFLEGFTSVIFQHEYDHLDGVLLTDREVEQIQLQYSPSTYYFQKNLQN